MEHQELVSVIIPVYNVEKYLRECIDSVLKQTYTNYEVILVDDGSTDTSGQICDEYVKVDERIRVIHQKNQGLSVTRNNGFRLSRGEYVYFLDSDDWILPETLYESLNRIKQEAADFLFFDAIAFTDESENFQVEQRYIRKNIYQTECGYAMLDKLQRNKEYHSAVQLLFIDRQFMERNNIYFEPNIIYEDMIFTYMLFCKAMKVAQLNKALYYRRYRSGSIVTSRKSKKNYLSARTVYQKVKEVSEENDKLGDEISNTYVTRCAFNALNIYRKLSNADRKECKVDYKKLKAMISEDRAYGNKSLYMRCYGTVPWFCYKVYEKSLGKILKGYK